MKTAKIVVLLVVALSLVGVAVAGPNRETSLKKLGLKAYWSVLREDQQVAAKEILTDHLLATAADRTRAGALLLGFRAEVLEVLESDQVRKAAKLKAVVGKLPREKKTLLLDRLLDGTDRATLVDLVERIGAAAPIEQVALGYGILDTFYDLLAAEYGERLGLSGAQQARIREFYETFKTDLRPIATRLAEARALTTRRALALLDAGQRAKLDTFRTTVLDKVLAFLEG